MGIVCSCNSKYLMGDFGRKFELLVMKLSGKNRLGGLGGKKVISLFFS